MPDRAAATLPNSRQMMGVSLTAYLDTDLSEITCSSKSRQIGSPDHQDNLVDENEWSRKKQQRHHRSLFRKRIKSISMPLVNAHLDINNQTISKLSYGNEKNSKKNPWSRSLVSLMRKLRPKHDELQPSLSMPLHLSHEGDRRPQTIDRAPAQTVSLDPLINTSCFEIRPTSNEQNQEHQTHLHVNNSSAVSQKTDQSSSDITMPSIFNTFFCCDDEDEEDILSLDSGLHNTKQSVEENGGDEDEPGTTSTTDWTYESCISSIKNFGVLNERPRSVTLPIDSSSAEDVAQKLWNNVKRGSAPSPICGPEGMAEWLGKNDPFRANVLKHYMDHFDFSNQRLDDAFRTLCSKLYFKAEAQQIDRILQTFASRYWECNPLHLLRNSDIVYAIAYSMLLLNTDLHVAQEKNRRKMTRSKFVRNTMATVYDLAFPLLPVDNIYLQKHKAHSLLPTSESVMSTLSASSMTAKPSSPKWMVVRRSVSLAGPNDMCHPSWESTASGNEPHHKDVHRWLSEVEALLKDIYNAVKTSRISQIDGGEGPMDDEQQKRRKRRGRSFLYARNATDRVNQDNDDCDMLITLASPLPAIEASPRAIRGGLAMKKHVMDGSNKKARQRGWQLCYLSVHNGILSIYRPTGLSGDGGNRVIGVSTSDRRRRSLSILLPGQTHVNRLDLGLHPMTSMLHQAYPHYHPLPSQILHRLDLKHALATALPSPTAADDAHHVFCLQTAEGGVWLFEAPDLGSVLEWVSVCNYWAARLSKEPLTGAVGNLDYGWGGSFTSSGPSLNESDGSSITTTPLAEWKPPLPCVVPSTLSEKEQLQALEQRALDIDKDLDLHREARQHIHQKFTGSPAQIQRALDNWERRAQYMIQELIKTRTYCDTLTQFIASS